MARYLDPKADIVFKKVFQDHPDLLKSFLNAVLPLPPDGLIVRLECLPTEQIPSIPILKRTIADVRCMDSQGRTFIVEMQIDWTDSFKQRLLFEASQAYVKQLEKGEEYHLLQPVYGLGLIEAIFDQETPMWYHHYRMVNVECPKRTVIEGLQLIFIELPKFEKQLAAEQHLRDLWLRFMCEVDEKTKQVSPELLAVPEIRTAVELVEEAAYTPAELEAYRSYWDSVSTEKTLLAGYYEEGLQEGISQGLSQGISQGEALLLLRQLTRKFGELPPKYRKKIEQADEKALLLWGERVLEASTLDEVFD